MTLESATAYPHLRRTKIFLRMFAPILSVSCYVVGAALFLRQALALIATGFELGERIEIGIWALCYLGGFGLAGWIGYRLCRSLGDVIDLCVDQVSASRRVIDVLEQQLLPAVERLAEAVKEIPVQSSRAQVSPLTDMTTEELLDHLGEVKMTGDAEEVLDVRQVLATRLSGAKRKRLDAELAGWFSKYFQKALRSGRAPLIAEPLARVIDALDGIGEIEHLKEALPIVRQSAGLCIECGRPYRGPHATCELCREEG